MIAEVSTGAAETAAATNWPDVGESLVFWGAIVAIIFIFNKYGS